MGLHFGRECLWEDIKKKGEALSLNDPSGYVSVKDDDMW